jgi:hypothetical protein
LENTIDKNPSASTSTMRINVAWSIGLFEFQKSINQLVVGEIRAEEIDVGRFRVCQCCLSLSHLVICRLVRFLCGLEEIIFGTAPDRESIRDMWIWMGDVWVFVKIVESNEKVREREVWRISIKGSVSVTDNIPLSATSFLRAIPHSFTIDQVIVQSGEILLHLLGQSSGEPVVLSFRSCWGPLLIRLPIKVKEEFAGTFESSSRGWRM